MGWPTTYQPVKDTRAEHTLGPRSTHFGTVARATVDRAQSPVGATTRIPTPSDNEPCTPNIPEGRRGMS